MCKCVKSKRLTQGVVLSVGRVSCVWLRTLFQLSSLWRTSAAPVCSAQLVGTYDATCHSRLAPDIWHVFGPGACPSSLEGTRHQAMFSPQMYKALRGLVGQRPVATPLSLRQQQHGHRAMCVASAAQSHLGPVLQFIAKGSLRLGSSAALLAGTAYALAQSNRASEDDPDHGPLDGGPAWLKELASREGVDEVLSPGQQLRKHPVGKLVVEQDHLVRRGRGTVCSGLQVSCECTCAGARGGGVQMGPVSLAEVICRHL